MESSQPTESLLPLKRHQPDDGHPSEPTLSKE